MTVLLYVGVTLWLTITGLGFLLFVIRDRKASALYRSKIEPAPRLELPDQDARAILRGGVIRRVS